MKFHSLQNSLIVCFLLVSSPAVAGHGFVTTFGDIEWLPEPGRTPDTVGYQFDSWSEAGQLWLATTARQVVDLSLGFAREKLAEAEAMLTVPGYSRGPGRAGALLVLYRPGRAGASTDRRWAG